MKKKVVLFYGSEHIKEDQIAWEVCEEIRSRLEKNGYIVEKTDDPDILISFDDRDYDETIIVDAAKGVDDVVELEDISQLCSTSVSTLHGYNLGLVLQILKAVGEAPKMRIIAIPYGEKDVKSASEKVYSIIFRK
jgi:Ni,Fe-hydrogenase maturation factor